MNFSVPHAHCPCSLIPSSIKQLLVHRLPASALPIPSFRRFRAQLSYFASGTFLEFLSLASWPGFGPCTLTFLFYLDDSFLFRRPLGLGTTLCSQYSRRRFTGTSFRVNSLVTHGEHLLFSCKCTRACGARKYLRSPCFASFVILPPFFLETSISFYH